MVKDGKIQRLIAMMVDAPMTISQMISEGGVSKSTALTFPSFLKRKGHNVVKAGKRGSYGYQIVPIDACDSVEAPAEEVVVDETVEGTAVDAAAEAAFA